MSKHLSRAAEPIDELVEAVVIERLSRPDAAESLTDNDTPNLQVLNCVRALRRFCIGWCRYQFPSE